MSAYLATLDAVLAEGVARLPRAFIDRQVRFVERRQTADGGFSGRQGSSDLYYTDFALRVLTLCAPDSPALPRAAHYLGQCPVPGDLVHACCLLNGLRMLRRCGFPIARAMAATFAPPDGGAYQTFLAALCCEMRGKPYPDVDAAVNRLRALRRADGGFAERPGEAHGQTNATAAVLGALALWERLTADEVSAVKFLAGMQADDGGLRAHPAVESGDLLSTFTGLLTLATLGEMTAVKLGAMGRFIRRHADPDGGCRGAVGDEADSEYTFYGLGGLALLALCVG